MAVTLRAITKDNWQECIKLEIAEGQEGSVLPNVYSLDEAKFHPTFVPLAIYADDTDGRDAAGDAGGAMVGFVMYGLYPDGVPPLGRTHWIFRLMVDRRHQDQGYGTAALHEVLRRLRDDPDCAEVLIGYEPENTVAEQLYRRLGFVEMGRAPWGETVARLALRAGVAG